MPNVMEWSSFGHDSAQKSGFHIFRIPENWLVKCFPSKGSEDMVYIYFHMLQHNIVVAPRIIKVLDYI